MAWIRSIAVWRGWMEGTTPTGTAAILDAAEQIVAAAWAAAHAAAEQWAARELSCTIRRTMEYGPSSIAPRVSCREPYVDRSTTYKFQYLRSRRTERTLYL